MKMLLKMKNSLCFFFLLVLAILLDSLYPLPRSYDLAILSLGAGLAIAGGAGLVSTIAGGFMNSNSVSSANQANLDAARETNTANRQMFDIQMDYNKYMYEDQKVYNEKLISMMNDYNKPAAQRQRFEEAGINPYFAMGNIDAGNASSQVGVNAPSAPAAPQMVTPTFQPNRVGDYVSAAGRDISSIMQSFANAENLQAHTQQTMIDNLTRFDENIARLENLRSSNALSKAQQDRIDEEIIDMRQQRQYVLDQLKFSAKKTESESDMAEIEVQATALRARSVELLNDYQEWLNVYSKKNGEKNLQQLDATIANIHADTAVKAMQKLETECRKKGIELDNEQKQKLLPLLERAQKLDNEQKELEIKYGSSWYQGLGRQFDKLKGKQTRFARRYQLRHSPVYIDKNNNMRW